MKILKRNQIIIYVFVLMLITAGYLNFSANNKNGEISQEKLQTSMQIESKDDTQIADIGDATLVNSSDVIVEEDEINKNDSVEENIQNEEIGVEENVEITEVNTQVTSTSEYFIKSKLDREQMYSQMLETYENILNTANSSETQKQSATEEMKKINEIRNKIMICENLITIKGFENNVVFVNDKSINIIVGAGELLQEEIAQIQNIISREMLADIENIHITTKN